MNKRKFNFSGLIALLLAVLVLVIIVPVNIISNYYDKNFDMTPSKMYTLSNTTQKVVNEASDKDVTIYFLWTLDELRDLPDLLPLYHTLKELDKYDNIEVIDFMTDEDPKLVESLNPTGNLQISDADVIVKCGDTIKRISSQKIFPSDSNGVTTYAGEELITGAIKIVTGGNLPNIYFLTGHGEKSIDDSYATFADILMSDNYAATELNLSEADAVPDDAAIIFIPGPQSDISSSEKAKLLAYAEKGGSFAVFLPPVEDKGRFTNIEDLLAEYDLGMDYNIVKETNSDYMMYNKDYELDPYVFNVIYPEATDSFTEDLTTDINSLVNEGAIGGISNTRSLYQISGNNTEYIEKSSIMTNVIDSVGAATIISIPFGGDDDTAESAKKLDGYQLELGFYSYNKQNGSKMIAVGTTDIIDADNMAASISVSQQLILNSVVWLYDSDIRMDIGNKGVTFDYMAFPGAEEANSTLRIFSIVPFVIAAIGLLVWLKRRHS